VVFSLWALVLVIGSLPVATGWFMKPSSEAGSYDAGQCDSSLLRRRESG